MQSVMAEPEVKSIRTTQRESIVTIRDLSKVYKQGEINVTALNRISLDIQKGEFLTLMGPSGSGKSTLLHIIAGIDRPTSAKCVVQGIREAKLPLADAIVEDFTDFDPSHPDSPESFSLPESPQRSNVAPRGN